MQRGSGVLSRAICCIPANQNASHSETAGKLRDGCGWLSTASDALWRTILVVGPADAGLSLLSTVAAARPVL
jgi:hypothetical protein